MLASAHLPGKTPLLADFLNRMQRGGYELLGTFLNYSSTYAVWPTRLMYLKVADGATYIRFRYGKLRKARQIIRMGGRKTVDLPGGKLTGKGCV